MARDLTKLVWIITISVMLDILVSVAIVYINNKANTATTQAHIAKVAIYESCLSGNDTRAQSRALWLSIAALLPDDPKGLVFKQHIVALTTQAFSPRDCGAKP